MNKDMNGKKASIINFSNGDSLVATVGTQLILSATYHGDRDEFWITVIQAGKEVARHNCRHIESITWDYSQ